MSSEGPTTGVEFTEEQIKRILGSLDPPRQLARVEVTSLGYNNRVYFLTTTCGQELVLKAGGRYWKRQKTEAEVAGLLVVKALCSEQIQVPRVVGFSSRFGDNSDLPWEWVLQEKWPGDSLPRVWDSLTESQKLNVAVKLAKTIVYMRSCVTLQSLGIRSESETSSLIGHLSLTPPEEDATGRGFDNKTFSLEDPRIRGRIHVSRIHNGPPASPSYAEYVETCFRFELANLIKQADSPEYAYELHRERLPRLQAVARSIRHHPRVERLDSSSAWRPVFTHGDFRPQNILVSLPGTSAESADPQITILDWEWAGFFPPHIEWEDCLDAIATLLRQSEGAKAEAAFLSTLDAHGVLTPQNAPSEEWEAATRLSRLIECITPWWLGGYPKDGGEPGGATREALEQKRLKSVAELDRLLEWFDG